VPLLQLAQLLEHAAPDVALALAELDDGEPAPVVLAQLGGDELLAGVEELAGGFVGLFLLGGGVS
jgi:hypothetical protein